MSISFDAPVQTRARLGVEARRGDPIRIEQATRDHAAAKIAAYIERVVASAPPLTDDQRLQLATLLRGGGAA